MYIPTGVCKNNFIAPSPILLNSSKRPWYLINEPPKNLTSSAEIRPFAVAATSSPSARQNIYADDTRNSHHPIGSRRLVQNSSNRHSTTKLDTFDHPEAHQTSENIRQQLRNTIFSSSNNQQFDSEYECDSSAEEPVYATLSAYSTYSATTTANDDFEFFRHIAIPDTASQHRINNHRTEEMPYQKYNNDTQDDPCIISKHQVLSRKTSPITRLVSNIYAVIITDYSRSWQIIIKGIYINHSTLTTILEILHFDKNYYFFKKSL